MGDTRVVLSDTGSLILDIRGLAGRRINGNDIVIPEKDAKITDIEITPNVKEGQWRFSDTISWKAFAPPLSDTSVVTSIEVESRIGGLFTLAVEDGLLHIRWS